MSRKLQILAGMPEAGKTTLHDGMLDDVDPRRSEDPDRVDRRFGVEGVVFDGDDRVLGVLRDLR